MRSRIAATPLDRSLRALRAVHHFQIWVRVVLSPEERACFESWARDDEKLYTRLVRRYRETEDEIDWENLLDEIQDLIMRSSPKLRRHRSFASKFAAMMERT